jgi:hypothetical protein
MLARTMARLLAVALTSAAAAAGTAVAPAHAATCPSASGVSVVVDFGGLGGGVQSACDPGSGETAWKQLEDTGFALTTVQRQPGFVCRVKGLPGEETEACVDTPPEDAYWALFWSDGKSGAWQYSSVGAASLKVPEGGSVALAWQSSESQRLPGAAPPEHASQSPSPEPTTPSGNDGGTGTGGGEGAGGGGGGSAAPQPGPTTTPSQSARSRASAPSASTPSSEATTPAEDARARKKARKDREEPRKRDRQAARTSVEAEDDPSITATQPPSDAASDDSGRVPTWVTTVVLAVLALVATAAVTIRRRRAG